MKSSLCPPNGKLKPKVGRVFYRQIGRRQIYAPNAKRHNSGKARVAKEHKPLFLDCGMGHIGTSFIYLHQGYFLDFAGAFEGSLRVSLEAREGGRELS